MKHGTISLIESGTPVVALATDGALFSKTMSNVEEVKARGAETLLFTVSDAMSDDASPDRAVVLPHCGELDIIPVSCALQLLAYHAANELGRNVDKPRNLAKSVTVE